ncbi:MAG TPA: histidine kinase [Ferruginibacter sp.]|nr:histidine kinase [Ferruginibacter sp.]
MKTVDIHSLKTAVHTIKSAVLIFRKNMLAKSQTFTSQKSRIIPPMQKRILLHISFWFCYLLFKTSQNIGTDLGGTPGSFAFSVLTTLFTAQLVLLIVKVPMVYALFYISNKYLAKQWNILKTSLAGFTVFLLSLAAFMPVKQFLVIERIYKINSSLSQALNFSSILSSLFILLFVSSLALTIKLVRSNIRQKETEQEIIKKKLETELQFLKAQTNPHFLFNTLNNIYALARKKSDDTADVVMKLSKLLRFMLYESQKQFIHIKDEVQVLDDYIELERIRYNEKLKLGFNRSIDDESQLIAPLILLPFVENAFKHGASESRFDSYISIRLVLRQQQLEFCIENSKSEDPASIIPAHIGLNNIRRQLELLYPGHQLEIESAGNRFMVSLKINLAKHATV